MQVYICYHTLRLFIMVRVNQSITYIGLFLLAWINFDLNVEM